MVRLITKRLALTVVVLAGMSAIAFLLTHVIPGNPARLLAGPHATASEVHAVDAQYGLTGTLWSQYGHYMSGLLHGQLGVSLTTGEPVTQNLGQFLPATIELAIAAAVLMITAGASLGIAAALRPTGIVANVTRLVSILGASMPIFWLGLLLQIVFFQVLNVLPVGGQIDPSMSAPTHITGLYVVDSVLSANGAALASSLEHLILPAVTLASGGVAIIARMTRASTLDVLESEYVRFGRAKGLRMRVVLLHHVLRNAMTPTLTVMGLQLGYILSGTVYTEMVFNWPGIGLYAENAITNLDYPAIMGVTMVFGLIYVIVNLLVDIGYLLLDPRQRALENGAGS